jgi:ankyrin repeat protein
MSKEDDFVVKSVMKSFFIWLRTLFRGSFQEERASFFLNGFYLEELSLDYIDLMLDNGADINETDHAGRNIFMHSAAGCTDISILEYILNMGIDINQRDDTGMPALMLAARYNENPDVIKFLVENGANVNATDIRKRNALIHAAIYSRTPEIIKTLLDLGADGTATDNRRLTAFDHLKRSNNVRLMRSFAFELLKESSGK